MLKNSFFKQKDNFYETRRADILSQTIRSNYDVCIYEYLDTELLLKDVNMISDIFDKYSDFKNRDFCTDSQFGFSKFGLAFDKYKDNRHFNFMSEGSREISPCNFKTMYNKSVMLYDAIYELLPINIKKNFLFRCSENI